MIRATLRNRMIATAAVMMALSHAAHADERLLNHAFSDNEVVRIDGKAGVQATIAFGNGEAIENVAVGDSQAWQITPNKRADLLFVKPLESTARTNMTVVTNRHTYFFDLVASAKARPLYMLRFTYKDEPKGDQLANPTLASLDPAEQALAAGDPSALPGDPAALNFSWKKAGVDKLLPTRVYDDGLSTYLLWPDRTPVPAILITNEKGDEGPVNYAVRGTTIVLEGVPDTIVLRSGKAKAELVNSYPLASRPAPAPLQAQTAIAAARQGQHTPQSVRPTVASNNPVTVPAGTIVLPNSQGN